MHLFMCSNAPSAAALSSAKKRRQKGSKYEMESGIKLAHDKLRAVRHVTLEVSIDEDAACG